MSEDTETTIPPALTPEEWAKRVGDRDGVEVQAFPEESAISIQDWGAMSGVTVESKDLPIVIALANAALPHGDLRKITRTWVNWLREEADVLQRNGAGAGAFMAAEIADALESYLPPK